VEAGRVGGFVVGDLAAMLLGFGFVGLVLSEAKNSPPPLPSTWLGEVGVLVEEGWLEVACVDVVPLAA
jgi:hypothetical protein